MGKVFSVHEYQLRPGADPQAFRASFSKAQERGLFELPGLVEWHLIHGLRGRREGAFAAIWIYESIEAWRRLWGTVEAPVDRDHYPRSWRIWEDEVLAPFLDQDPDRISFTAYLEIVSGPECPE